MKFYLYIIVFPNNKKYVGITTNIIIRKNKHKYRANNKKYNHLKLYRAINKYGFNNLKWNINSNYLSWDELNKIEIETISKLQTTKKQFGYNTTCGGKGHYGFSPTKETRDKISKANKYKPKPPGFKEHLSKIRKGSNNPMYGKKTSKKQKESVSKISSGENNTNAKLTNKQVDIIRYKYKIKKYLIKNLAKEYNLNRNTIAKIVKNKSYIDSNYSTSGLLGNNKLTFIEAEKIRKLYKYKKYTQKKIAKIFNVSHHTIFRIVNNKNYIP